MNELELLRIKKSQAVIAKIAVDGKRQGLSYGQLQAQRYEQQLKLQAIEARCSEPVSKPQSDECRRIGRPHKQKPDGFDYCVKMIHAGELSVNKAAGLLHTSVPTLRKWLRELVSDGESC